MSDPPGWQPQPHSQQPQWQPQPPAESSGKATASLVLAICGLFLCPVLLSIVGLVLGYQARDEIQRSGGRLTGAGNAKAGIIVSWVGLAIWMLFLAFFIIGLGAFGGMEVDQGFSLLIPSR